MNKLVPIGLLALVACPTPMDTPTSAVATNPTPAQPAASPAAPAAPGDALARYRDIARTDLPRLDRHDFNRLAALEHVAIFWLQAELNPANLLELSPSALGPYIKGDALTPAFDALYARLVDLRRIESVEKELNSGWLTAVVTDMRDAPEVDKKLVEHIRKAATIIEELYAVQRGTAAIGQPPADKPSRELLRRTQGYWCEGPETRDDPFCGGLLNFPEQISDAYPRGEKQDAMFCEQLRKHPDAAKLMDPFSVVRKKRGTLVAVSYLEVYGERMRRVAAELKLAAAVLGDDEAAFKAYLLATAQGFESNNWDAADEAWVKMNSQNSKWYLRLAPDEVYFDPCNSKAGFHVSFARINAALVEWQAKLTPLRDQMEKDLAAHIGKPYAAREVVFSLPDFIEIVINAGDARNAFGATVGQSLPNWGPVSERGDGRTVVMTNLYSGPDSKAVYKQKAALLLHPDSLAQLPATESEELLDILLHEATHNFGPHSDYKLDGKPPREIFGGLLSSIVEELKAQTGALWFTEYLRGQGVIDATFTRHALTGSIVWCFGQMSRGLYGGEGKRNVYPTLAAIQVGFFIDEGALIFEPELDPAGNGDTGRFRIDYKKLVAAVDKLMKQVGQIKATGDKAAAEKLVNRYTDAAGQKKIQQELVQERMLRFPKESFVYSVRM